LRTLCAESKWGYLIGDVSQEISATLNRKLFLLLLGTSALLLVHTYLPHQKAIAFIAGIQSADEKRISELLPSDVCFRRDDSIQDWYSFYLHDKLIIGPFPLENYRDAKTLNLRLEKPTLYDWIVGQRSVRVFGQQFTKKFIISIFGTSYTQGRDPQGQAG